MAYLACFVGGFISAIPCMVFLLRAVAEDPPPQADKLPRYHR